MNSIIVTTHGDFAKGIKDTMLMIMGEQENIFFLPFKPGENPESLETKLNVIINSIPQTHEILLLTDLYGGTPNNVACKFKIMDPKRIEVVSGLNLPMLMTCLINRQTHVSKLAKDLTTEAQKGIVQFEYSSANTEDE